MSTPGSERMRKVMTIIEDPRYMNEYMTQRWKAPSAQLQLSASENGKPHDVRVTGNGFTARARLKFCFLRQLEIWKMFRCACTISRQDTEYSRPQRSMSHQPTDSSFLVYWCIRRTTPRVIWSPAPTCGFEKAETHTAKVQESGTLILRHG